MHDIVGWDFGPSDVIDGLINELAGTDKGKLKLIGIDGMCGAGKTALAKYISEKFDACVIHMDDFFLPPGLRTVERLTEPGGNVHYERLAEEVIEPLLSGKSEIKYRKFNCHMMDYEREPIELLKKDLYIIEGSYSLRPELKKLYALSLFMKCDAETQKDRIIGRNGLKRYEMFRDRWIPMEERYFSKLNIEHAADYIITT